MTICIWDLETEGIAETKYITLTNVGVLSFIQADYLVPEVGLARQS